MSDTKKIAIVLAGCGVYDGAEIHEATMSMLAVVKAGASYQLFAPDIMQHHVINHLTGDEMPEQRNVLVEAARIARGNIKPLSSFRAPEFDALLFPGGFGVAKNLSDFAFKGANCQVKHEVEQAVLAMYQLQKPIGALCIAPAIMVKILEGATVTIGSEASTIDQIEKAGGDHHITSQTEVVVDQTYKLVTSPCYMLNANILEIAQGADNVVKHLMALM
jgi:enhancing lycopene biosynthesis protein 2